MSLVLPYAAIENWISSGGSGGSGGSNQRIFTCKRRDISHRVNTFIMYRKGYIIDEGSKINRCGVRKDMKRLYCCNYCYELNKSALDLLSQKIKTDTSDKDWFVHSWQSNSAFQSLKDIIERNLNEITSNHQMLSQSDLVTLKHVLVNEQQKLRHCNQNREALEHLKNVYIGPTVQMTYMFKEEIPHSRQLQKEENVCQDNLSVSSSSSCLNYDSSLNKKAFFKCQRLKQEGICQVVYTYIIMKDGKLLLGKNRRLPLRCGFKLDMRRIYCCQYCFEHKKKTHYQAAYDMYKMKHSKQGALSLEDMLRKFKKIECHPLLKFLFYKELEEMNIRNRGQRVFPCLLKKDVYTVSRYIKPMQEKQQENTKEQLQERIKPYQQKRERLYQQKSEQLYQQERQRPFQYGREKLYQQLREQLYQQESVQFKQPPHLYTQTQEGPCGYVKDETGMWCCTICWEQRLN